MGNQAHRQSPRNAALIMKIPKNTHVAVLMGGWSPEREVSLRSGDACGRALESAGFRVTLLDVRRDIAAVLDELKPDVAFNALHGKWGEDGTVQGILETLDIPYTHSGVLASAVAMHKEKSKCLFRAAGVPVAESILVDHAVSPTDVVMCSGVRADIHPTFWSDLSATTVTNGR